MANQETPLLERLCKAESPYEFRDWNEQNGYYVTTCRASIKDVPRLIEIAKKWSDPDWPEGACGLDIGRSEIDLLPVTAWRTLADLKSSESVEPLIDMLCEADVEFDDWASSELPEVFGKIGDPSIELLIRLAKDTDRPELVRSIAVRGLRGVAKYHGETSDRIVACLTEMMTRAATMISADKDDIEFNTTLLVELVELQAGEAAEAIERAFAGDLLDVGMMGDWEEVRRELGVAGLRLEMPKNPHNSIKQLQRRMGVGVFSKEPIFQFGEIDPDAEQAYYKRARDIFSKSKEADWVVKRHDNLGWFQVLLEYGINYLGESVDEMTVISISEFVLDYVPRKVSTEPESADSIVFEITAFWEYLNRVFELPEANAIVEWLRADGIASKLKAKLSDSGSFGIAKSIFMAGKDAGYDMTSEADMAAFVAAYNRSLRSGAASAQTTTVSRKQKVRRNDPCPCGSGKKYKKCCR